MDQEMKIWLAVAAALILIGGAVFVGVMAVLGWDFAKLSTVKFETNEHVITDAYRSITVKTSTADVLFVPSEKGETSVVCYEAEKVQHSVLVTDDELIIEEKDTRKWYEHIGIHFNTPKITVYLPAGEYGKLFVKNVTGNTHIPAPLSFEIIECSGSTGTVECTASVREGIYVSMITGKIRLAKLSAGLVDLSVTTGQVSVSDISCSGDVQIKVSTGKASAIDVRCRNLTSKGTTGSLVLQNVIAEGEYRIQRSTGDVTLDRCDASEIFIKTSTGSVKGTLLSEKIFVTSTSTGSVNVPDSTTGGRCQIKTSTGNIKISVEA